MIVRTIVTALIVILGILFIMGITVPMLKDSITNYDLNKEQSLTKIIWSVAQLLAIIYIIYKRMTKPNRTNSNNRG